MSVLSRKYGDAMSVCANRTCKAQLGSENRSEDNPAFCAVCGDNVWAFRPDSEQPDDWFIVCETSVPVEGLTVAGGQCGGCGLSEYRIDKLDRWSWAAVCAGQTWDGDFIEGCGTKHPIRTKLACEVIF